MKFELINEVSIKDITQQEIQEIENDFIITDKAIAIEENGVIQLLKTEQENEYQIIYGI